MVVVDRPPVKYSLNLQPKAEESPPQRAAYLFHQSAGAERVAASLDIQRVLLVFFQPSVSLAETDVAASSLTCGVPSDRGVITSL